MKIFSKLTLVIFLSLVIVICFFVSSIAFLERNDEIVFDQQKEQLIKTAENNVNTLNLFMKEFIRALEIGANIIHTEDGWFDLDQIYGILNDIKEMGNFLSVSIDSQQGFSYLQNGDRCVLQQPYLERMKKKEVIISDIIYNKGTSKNFSFLRCPLFTRRNK